MRSLIFASLFLASTVMSNRLQAQVVPINPGDRIVLIGNTLAERFQYFGYLESLLQRQFPNHKLTVRNLGYSADEVRFRPRSLDFGEPDKHLTLHKADVILAFFGFNESFKGVAGVKTFKKELTDFIKHTRQQKYNGQTSPRLVLFSPIAHENANSPNLPSGEDTNPNIEMYSKAMAAVAQEHNVPFVDLFTMSQRLFKSESENLTFNGIHLTDVGYQKLSSPLLLKLAGRSTAWSGDLEPLRAEVLEKNFNHFHDYRAVNGFYIYGGRSRRDHSNPPFTDAYVIENERAKLREMAAVVDQRIWKIAAGGIVNGPADYSKTRQLYDVPTNFKQPTEIKPPEEAIKMFTVADGYKVNLFASEVDWPELKNPVNFTFDERGRLWVAIMPSYPQYLPPFKPNDKILIFEDTDGDGKADKMDTFADGLHLPTGFELGDGGAYVAQEPNLVFLKDTDGDGKADLKNILLHGFDSGDSHHAIGAFIWGPGGGIYMHEGTFHHTQVETPWGPIRNAHGAVYRYDPTRQRLTTFVSYNFANPWGHCFDKWGQNFVADASGGANYFGTAFSFRPHQFTGQDDFGPFKFKYTNEMQQFFPKRVRPTSGCEIVSSRHFPDEAQGNYLLNNVIGFQGVLQHKVKEEGSGFVGKEIEPLLFSSDRNFRPTDLQFGPDGALYIVDWFNPLVGHMQHSLRDPNRDHSHGRIWRITYPSRPLVKPPRIADRSVPELLNLLTTYEDRTRQHARRKLREFPTKQVLAGINQWVAGLSKDDNYEHNLLEALWVMQNHNVVDQNLLNAVLTSPDYHARAAATRVLCYMREQVPEALALLYQQANDAHPRVRLEAVRASSFFDDARAAEVALEVLNHPTDYYIDYTLKHTISRLEEFWKPSVASGKSFAANNPKAAGYIIDRLETFDLINMVRSRPVFEEMLSREGVVHQYRKEALMGLAKLNGTDMVTELFNTIDGLDKAPDESAERVLADMTHFFHGAAHAGSPTNHHEQAVDQESLAAHRDRIATLARSAKRNITRRVANVALITADGTADRAWTAAIGSPEVLRDLMDSVPLMPDAVRSSLYDRILPLTTKLPAPMEQQLKQAKGIGGRFVRIENPGKGKVLTLVEVQVMSGGKNIARTGQARQSSTAFGGVAGRAIDGNTSPVYGQNGQTHTSEQQQNPWWEVDLGKEYPIESVTIFNRNEEGKYADRLDGFVIKVLDANRDIVFRKQNAKAPLLQASYNVQGNPRVGIHRAAMNALSSIAGFETQTFTALAPLVGQAQYRAAAVKSLGRLKRSELPKDQIRPVVDQLIRYIESVPEASRTRTDVMDAIQLGKDFSSLLARAEAIGIRRRLAELAVDVIVIRPVPHRMLYDRDHIYVVKNKPVELVFENTDIMPHNLVITKPGAREEVGILAEKLGSTPLGFEKQFIPDTDKLLHATGMLQPDKQERLRIKAPAEVGEYPYVCTFPGHWRTMWGTMHVVNDISDIPLDQPQPTHDHDAVPRRQFVRKWTADDILNAVGELDRGRSFANAQLLFTSVSCVQCHRMGETGGQVGPNLADVKQKLATKKMDLNLLVHSLTLPSKDIEKKYRTNIIIDAKGKPYSGVVTFEDDTVVRLASNPLDKNAKVTEINKDEIEEREESLVSIMPEGLLNTMTREEIFDLLAYLISGGDPEHAAFQP